MILILVLKMQHHRLSNVANLPLECILTYVSEAFRGIPNVRSNNRAIVA
jgi:hypothetical protein